MDSTKFKRTIHPEVKAALEARAARGNWRVRRSSGSFVRRFTLLVLAGSTSLSAQGKPDPDELVSQMEQVTRGNCSEIVMCIEIEGPDSRAPTPERQKAGAW